jgi:hypothetical protein
MEERDYYWLSLCILVLCGCVWTLAHRTEELRSDVNWLKDNTVAHETETRPG